MFAFLIAFIVAHAAEIGTAAGSIITSMIIALLKKRKDIKKIKDALDKEGFDASKLNGVL